MLNNNQCTSWTFAASKLTMAAAFTSSFPSGKGFDVRLKLLLSSAYRHCCDSRVQKLQTGFSPVQRTFFFLQLRQAWRILLRRLSWPSESSWESDITTNQLLSFSFGGLVNRWREEERERVLTRLGRLYVAVAECGGPKSTFLRTGYADDLD